METYNSEKKEKQPKDNRATEGSGRGFLLLNMNSWIFQKLDIRAFKRRRCFNNYWGSLALLTCFLSLLRDEKMDSSRITDGGISSTWPDSWYDNSSYHWIFFDGYDNAANTHRARKTLWDCWGRGVPGGGEGEQGLPAELLHPQIVLLSSFSFSFCSSLKHERWRQGEYGFHAKLFNPQQCWVNILSY